MIRFVPRRLLVTAATSSLFLALAGLPASAASSDPLRPQQWALDVIGKPDPSVSRATGEGITVAVIDTGVDLDHEDLKGKVIAGPDFVDDDDVPQDEHGHGTHVAGIVSAIAGNGKGVSGVAPRARILAIRVLDADGEGSGADVNAAVRWAADQNADVINLSLGDFGRALAGPLLDEGFSRALEYAWDEGSIPVVAAGNSSFFSSGYVDEPALIVTATDRNDRRAGYASTVGNANWAIAAPGGDGRGAASGGILSTYFDPDKPNTYAVASGTSMAAPHVAGAAAVLRGLGKTPQQTVDILLSTAVDLGAEGRDSTYGSGRLDLAAALRRAAPESAPRPATTSAPKPAAARPSAPAAGPRLTPTTAGPRPVASPTTTGDAPAAPSSAPTAPATDATGAPDERTPSTEVALRLQSEPRSNTGLTAFAALLWIAVGIAAFGYAARRRLAR